MKEAFSSSGINMTSGSDDEVSKLEEENEGLRECKGTLEVELAAARTDLSVCKTRIEEQEMEIKNLKSSRDDALQQVKQISKFRQFC